MARRISLSRAARLVGVKRGVLQQQIRAGELKTFEGEIVLPDLLQAYPNAQIEDSSMLERVEQIIEQATFITAETAARKPDNKALGARIMSLGKDLSRQRRLIGGYRNFVRELNAQLSHREGESDARRQLREWIDQTTAMVENDDDTIDQPFVNETFLRVMTAQATVLPSGHEFFVEGAESILEAVLRGGLALDYGCSNGNCGLCKMRVVSGETRKIRHHDYSLSEAEKGIGYILGCSNTAVSDVVLEADEAQIYLFWVASDDDPPYLHNLCRAWNDALDNFEYVPLSAREGERIDDHIESRLKAANPAAFDYYLCAGEQMRTQIEEFAARQAIPKHQLLCEAV